MHHDTRRRFLSFVLLSCSVAASSHFAPRTFGDDDADAKRLAQLERAKKAAAATTEETYELRYKFAANETVRWKVTHLATTETTISGNTQTSQMRSISTKVWRFQGGSPTAPFTFVHSVSDVDMWQKVTGRPEIRYDSKSSKEVPPEYVSTAKTVGVPLATLTIDARGQVTQRQNTHPQFDMGLGAIVMPMPEGRVAAGHVWYVPDEVFVRMPDGRQQRIKSRQVCTLEKVVAGVATISVKSHVLMPVDDPKIKSQLIQQLPQGTVRFDLDAGRLLSKQMDWDELVVGFSGADSRLKYLARFTEELLDQRAAAAPEAKTEPPVEPTASEPDTGDSPSKPTVRTADTPSGRPFRDDKPALRR